MVYVEEMVTIGGGGGGDVEIRNRTPEIPECYYTVETLRQATQDTMNGFDRLLPGAYGVRYDALTARLVFTNDATRFNDSFSIYTRESVVDPNKPATFPDTINNNGAWLP